MAKRTKMPTDLNQRAKAIVDLASSDEPVPNPDEGKDPAAVGKRVTPAMAAGVERHPWSLTQIAELLD